LLVVGAAVALAVGSYSALAGAGPVTSVAGAVIGADAPDDGDVVGDADDDDGVVAQQDGEGAQHIAQLIADAFGDGLTAAAADVSQGDVLALHEQGIGFGAIFKLYLLSAAGDETAAAILSSGEKGEGGFAFGKLFKEFADGVSVLTDGEDGVPKNLGQAVSHAKKGDKGAAVAAIEDGDEDDGDGPPDHAPAHGRR
jgi:hypothetical protein